MLGLRNLYGKVVVINPSAAVAQLIDLTLTERVDGFTVRRESAGSDSPSA